MSALRGPGRFTDAETRPHSVRVPHRNRRGDAERASVEVRDARASRSVPPYKAGVDRGPFAARAGLGRKARPLLALARLLRGGLRFGGASPGGVAGGGGSLSGPSNPVKRRHAARLETRTKESNMYASVGAPKPRTRSESEGREGVARAAPAPPVGSVTGLTRTTARMMGPER